jgi:tetratricopeptide (TPR) repeat protein
MPGNQSLAVHLGHIYKLNGADDKSKKQYNEAIDNLQPNQGAVISLSQAFYKYKEIDYVIKTLATGKKIMRGIYPFNMELADAYNAKGDHLSMYKEYLEVLTLNEAYLSQIQSILQSYIGDEFKGAKADELRIQLLKHIQQYPDKPVYAEFLIGSLFNKEILNLHSCKLKHLIKEMHKTLVRCSIWLKYVFQIKSMMWPLNASNMKFKKASRIPITVMLVPNW